MQGRLRRVNDEVAQREAETLGVLMENQRPGTLPAHADPLPSRPGRHRRPRVVAGRGETIPPALSLWTGINTGECTGFRRIRPVMISNSHGVTIPR